MNRLRDIYRARLRNSIMLYEEEKKELIKNGAFKRFKKQSWKAFLNGMSVYERLGDEFSLHQYECLTQLFNAYKAQKSRLKQWITYYMHSINDYTVCFATFTIKPECTIKNPRKYLTNRLKEESLSGLLDYALNVDYGTINGRMHYHAILIYGESP